MLLAREELDMRFSLVRRVIGERSVARSTRELGQDCGRYVIPDDFNAPLDEAVLRDFEGRDRNEPPAS